MLLKPSLSGQHWQTKSATKGNICKYHAPTHLPSLVPSPTYRLGGVFTPPILCTLTLPEKQRTPGQMPRWSVKNVSLLDLFSVVACCLHAVGEKKLGRVICPDPWKSGARNTIGKAMHGISPKTVCL